MLYEQKKEQSSIHTKINESKGSNFSITQSYVENVNPKNERKSYFKRKSFPILSKI